MLGVEKATSAPATPKSVVSISSQNTPDGEARLDRCGVEPRRSLRLSAELGTSYTYIDNVSIHVLMVLIIRSPDSARRQKMFEKQEKRKRKNERLNEIVDQRLKKKIKAESGESKEPIPPGDAEKAKSPVKTRSRKQH